MHKAVRKAVFPAAGLGTRFLPATKSQPKEMLPLVDKPIIQYGVEETVASGVENIIIVTGRGKSAIEDHFDVSFELENLLESRGKVKELELVRRVSELIHVSYIRQKEALGLGHAVLVTKELVADEPFAVVLADDVIVSDRPCLRQLLDVHEQRAGSVLAVMEVPADEISRYGVIAADQVGSNDRLFRVRDMVEKPPADKAPSNLAIIGRYVLAPEIFAALAETQAGSLGEIQLTDGIRRLMESEPVYAYRFEGRRYDAGDKLGFLKATVELALKNEDLGPDFSRYLDSLNSRTRSDKAYPAA
jgi:UTP--glucose-1-phosphate uridylyltransferase